MDRFVQRTKMSAEERLQQVGREMARGFLTGPEIWTRSCGVPLFSVFLPPFFREFREIGALNPKLIDVGLGVGFPRVLRSEGLSTP